MKQLHSLPGAVRIDVVVDHLLQLLHRRLNGFQRRLHFASRGFDFGQGMCGAGANDGLKRDVGESFGCPGGELDDFLQRRHGSVGPVQLAQNHGEVEQRDSEIVLKMLAHGKLLGQFPPQVHRLLQPVARIVVLLLPPGQSTQTVERVTHIGTGVRRVRHLPGDLLTNLQRPVQVLARSSRRSICVSKLPTLR